MQPQERRFEFGRNWLRFSAGIDGERIAAAKKSLQTMLQVNSLKGRTFLDAGCGSGLFSLAAKRLGARVRSFDYDPLSVEATRNLKQCHFEDDPHWQIEQGDVLDSGFVRSLGIFDIVYSWGVLHHTGAMWKALENIQLPAAENGTLFIAIYNFQTGRTELSKRLKKAYVNSPRLGKSLISGCYVGYKGLRGLLVDMLRMRSPLRRYRQIKKARGMSLWHDWIDWLGGYPFEAAKPEEIFDFMHRAGWEMVRLKTVEGRHGNNEFVFKRKAIRQVDAKSCGSPQTTRRSLP